MVERARVRTAIWNFTETASLRWNFIEDASLRLSQDDGRSREA